MTRVSVCIPVYNGGSYIAEAISSTLHQSHDDLEVVVVDNCSTDGTADIVRGIDDQRIRLLQNDRNIGAIPNWNRALRETTGDFVKLLCADDVIYPGVIAEQVDILSSDATIALVAGRRDVIDVDGRVVMRSRGLGNLAGGVTGGETIRRAVRFGGNLIGEPLAVMMPRRVVEQIGGFADREPYLVDLDYWLRALRTGSLYAMRSTVGGFRISDEAWTSELAKQQGPQSRSFLRSAAAESPGDVGRVDLAIGVARSTARSAARRGFLTWHSSQRRRSSPVRVPVSTPQGG